MRRTAVLALFVITCVLVVAWGEQRKPVVPPLQKPRLEAQTSPEQMKRIVHRVFEDLFNNGRYDAISEIYSSDCVVHEPNGTVRLDRSVAEGKGWRSAAPALRMTPSDRA